VNSAAEWEDLGYHAPTISTMEDEPAGLELQLEVGRTLSAKDDAHY
jgi:hypothetical protein